MNVVEYSGFTLGGFEMSWISLEDKLPLEGVLVLATGLDYGDKSKERHYVVAMRIKNYWYDGEDADSEFTYLTHWQPLPNPPKN